jgi:hypothetical protein
MEDELLDNYVAKIKPVLDLAKRAYGSRATESPQHEASRQYTKLLVEFYEQGGSLLRISKALGVTYAGVRRRVTTYSVPANASRIRSKATPEEVQSAAERIKVAKLVSVPAYHEALRHEYEDNKISLNKLAKALGLSSSNPLYYGVARTKMSSK